MLKTLLYLISVSSYQILKDKNFVYIPNSKTDEYKSLLQECCGTIKDMQTFDFFISVVMKEDMSIYTQCNLINNTKPISQNILKDVSELQSDMIFSKVEYAIKLRTIRKKLKLIYFYQIIYDEKISKKLGIFKNRFNKIKEKTKKLPKSSESEILIQKIELIEKYFTKLKASFERIYNFFLDNVKIIYSSEISGFLQIENTFDDLFLNFKDACNDYYKVIREIKGLILMNFRLEYPCDWLF